MNGHCDQAQTDLCPSDFLAWLAGVRYYCSLVEYAQGGRTGVHEGEVTLTPKVHGRQYDLRCQGRWRDLAVSVESCDRWSLHQGVLTWSRETVPGRGFTPLFQFSHTLNALGPHRCGQDRYDAQIQWRANRAVICVWVRGKNKKGRIQTQLYC